MYRVSPHRHKSQTDDKGIPAYKSPQPINTIVTHVIVWEGIHWTPQHRVSPMIWEFPPTNLLNQSTPLLLTLSFGKQLTGILNRSHISSSRSNTTNSTLTRSKDKYARQFSITIGKPTPLHQKHCSCSPSDAA